MKFLLTILIAITASLCSALIVNHVPPKAMDPELQTEIRVEIIQGMDEISEAYIMFRTQGTEIYNFTAMEKAGADAFWMTGYLPVPTDPESGYEYYFKFVLTNNSIETHPKIEPEQNPYSVLPAGKGASATEDFILLSDQAVIQASDGYILAVSWFALEGSIDPGTIRIFVNGRDVTKPAIIMPTMMLYKDISPQPGIYTSYITARTVDGDEIKSSVWSTVVKGEKGLPKLPLNLRGSLNAGTSVLSSSRDENAATFGNDRDDGWASLDLHSEYEKLKLSSYTYMSTLQRVDAQNVNRFRLAVMLPVWDNFLGDYSPYLSNLSMSNKNIRGIYSSFHSRYFGLSFAHGEMVRAVDGKEVINTTTKETNYTPGTFKQEAIAARMRLGSEKGFQLGFTTTRNRDIISSLDERYILQYSKADTIQMVFPKDNLVLSMDARLSAPNNEFVVGVEGASSLYNSNTLPGPFTTEDLEEYFDTDTSLNPADFQDIFIINTNMQPLPLSFDTDDWRESLSSLSSMLAWQAYMRGKLLDNTFNVRYTSTGSAFRALSTGYLQNDATQLTVSDNYNYRQFFFLSGGYTQNRDNLSRVKIETNNNQNIFGQAMLRLTRLPYLSVSYTVSKGENDRNDEIDITDPALYSPYERNSNLLSLGLGYDFEMLPVAPTNVELGWRSGSSYEERETAAKAMAKQYELDNQSISLGLTSRFRDIPLRTLISFANNLQDDVLLDAQTSNFNFQLRGEYRLLGDKVNPWAEYRLTSLGGDQDKQSYNYITFGVNTRPLKDTFVSTDLGWQIYGNKDTEQKDYTRTIWRLTLSQRF